MADQRPFSRFRLPWLSAATAPQPQPQPQLQQQTTRPIEIVAPAQPQRPPFRPAGIAQGVQPTQPPARTEPQPPAPARGASGPQAGSPPTSPARETTRARAGSVPPSPARGATQPRSTSVPPSPTRPTSQPKPTAQTTAPKVTRLPHEGSQASRFPPSPTLQQPKPAVSLQEAAEKVKEIERKRDAEKQKAKELTSQAREDKKTVATGSSHPKPRNKSTESHQKPGMSNGEQNPLQKEIKDNITKFVHKLATGQPKHPIDDKPVSITTIAGDNKGASMHVSSEPVKKEGSVHIYRGYRLNPDESFGTTTDAEDDVKGEKPKDPTEEPEKMTFINSNIQSINNSMLLESSVNEGSPGVHLVLSQSLADPIKEEEPLETHKAEFSVTSAQKLTYNPTIRRRCLRGLFMESSDSDPDNPEKPRRHGCRYYCGEKRKDKDLDIL